MPKLHPTNEVAPPQEQGMRWLPVFLAVVVVCLLSLQPLQANARTVLMLVDNDLDSTFSSQLKGELIEGIRRSDAEIYIQEVPTDYEYLVDAISPNLTHDLAANIEMRFSSGRLHDAIEFDEIIAQGTASGRFLDNVPDLYPKAERSFFHILWEPETGVSYPSDIDPALSFDLILEALPQTQHVVLYSVVTNPDAPTGPIEFGFEAAWLRDHKTDIDFELKNLLDPSADLIAHAQSLPANSAAVYVLYRDTRPPAPEFHQWLTSQSKLPLFGVFEHNIDQFLGGVVISAQRLATAMLAKANQEKTVFSAQESMQKIINWQAAQQWHIDTAELPASVEIRGAPDTNVARDVVYILIGVATLVIFALIVALLAISRARLKLERERWAEMAEHAADQTALLTKIKSTREMSAIGEWFWNPHDGSFSFDAVGAVLVGLEPPRGVRDEYLRVTGWNQMINPEDIGDVENYLHCVKAGLKEPQLVFRVAHKNGEERIIRGSGATPERDHAGNLLGIRGLMRDITESHTTRERLLAEIGVLKAKL